MPVFSISTPSSPPKKCVLCLLCVLCVLLLFVCCVCCVCCVLCAVLVQEERVGVVLSFVWTLGGWVVGDGSMWMWSKPTLAKPTLAKVKVLVVCKDFGFGS